MAEYIEREALIRYAEKQRVIIVDGTSVADAMRIQGNVFRRCVETAPAADVRPVVKGEWIKPTPCSQEYCNQCGLTPKMIFGLLPNFCPHCGADMRKDGAE